MPMWSEANQLRFAQRLRDLQTAILEQLGAGYYAYGSDKRAHYDRSRSLIGSALAPILDEIRILLQLSHDMHIITSNAYGELSELTASIGRQIGGFAKTVPLV